MQFAGSLLFQVTLQYQDVYLPNIHPQSSFSRTAELQECMQVLLLFTAPQCFAEAANKHGRALLKKSPTVTELSPLMMLVTSQNKADCNEVDWNCAKRITNTQGINNNSEKLKMQLFLCFLLNIKYSWSPVRALTGPCNRDASTGTRQLSCTVCYWIMKQGHLVH